MAGFITRRSGWLLRARASAAPIVLLVVLASHVSLRSSSDLTPWKGGGFGMFSTVDSPASRVVRVELDTELGVVPVALPSGLEDLAGAARAAPSGDRLLRLARGLAERWWVVPRLAAPSARSGSAEEERLRELAIEALNHVIPAEAVQAVEPGRFEEATQRRLDVRRVTVAVLRLDASGRGALRPKPIRTLTLELARPDREVTP